MYKQGSDTAPPRPLCVETAQLYGIHAAQTYGEFFNFSVPETKFILRRLSEQAVP